MKVIKKLNYKGSLATLFANGDVMWAGMHFPQGLGMNAGLAAALTA